MENQTESILPAELRKNSYDYKLLKREGDIAIYTQSHKGEVIGYEVFKVLWKKGATINGQVIKPGEKFPSDNDFGKTAWACSNLERAELRFQEFLNKTKTA